MTKRHDVKRFIQNELDHLYSDVDFSHDVDDMNEVFGGETGEEEHWWEEYQVEQGWKKHKKEQEGKK